jgi:hypothetical protein
MYNPHLVQQKTEKKWWLNIDTPYICYVSQFATQFNAKRKVNSIFQSPKEKKVCTGGNRFLLAYPPDKKRMFSGKSFCKEEAPSQVFVEFTIIPS